MLKIVFIFTNIVPYKPPSFVYIYLFFLIIKYPDEEVLLLLPMNFKGGFRLELMYISLIKSIRSSLTYLHGFQLLMPLP